jgi:hypothetical protein
MLRQRSWITLPPKWHELKAAPTRMAINTTIGGERFEDAAISTLRQGASHAIGATLAHQIGQLYQGPDKLGYFTHKLAHFASGALSGTIMANDPFGGAFGAAFAEVAMEAMVDAKAEATAIKQENPNLPKEELEKQLHDRLMAKRFFSQVIGGFVGTIAGKGNFSLAASTAAIALDYNMMPTLLDEACREYYGLTTEALDARESGRTSPSIVMSIAIDEYAEGIEAERTLREQDDISIPERLASKFREWSLHKAIDEANEVIHQRNIHKATHRLMDGTSTAEDRQLLLLGVGQIASSAMIRGKSKPQTNQGAKPAAKISAAKIRPFEAEDTLKVTREMRWRELATVKNSRLPKAVVNHIKKSDGKGVSRIFGLELAHKPGMANAQGHDYKSALPKTIADHRGIQHRFLREFKDGTTILKPPYSHGPNKLTLPKPGKLPGGQNEKL